MNSIFILNTLVVVGIITAAVLAVVFDKLLSAIIALSAVGSFMALEFILLHAPDVAIAEASVGAVLSPIIFIIALKKVKEGREE
jgi:uncharacterized MnhB-related membrane protein